MRIMLSGAKLDLAGLVATATVELTFGNCRATQKAVGRNVPERHRFLVAEATARAITVLFPPGFGVVLHSVAPARPDVGAPIWTQVVFLTPTREESLQGIVAVGDDPSIAVAKSVLHAVNRRVEFWLHPKDKSTEVSSMDPLTRP